MRCYRMAFCCIATVKAMQESVVQKVNLFGQFREVLRESMRVSEDRATEDHPCPAIPDTAEDQTHQVFPKPNQLEYRFLAR